MFNFLGLVLILIRLIYLITQIISNIFDPISKLPVSEPEEVANAFNEFFTNINGDSNLTLDDSKDFINEKFRSKNILII
jgi:hypothetical protein